MKLLPADEKALQEALRGGLSCDLCGSPMSEREFSQAVRDVSGLDICAQCLEDSIHASAFDARSEMGLVGSGGGRS